MSSHKSENNAFTNKNDSKHATNNNKDNCKTDTNSKEYTNILNNIDADQYKQQLNIEINNLINFYRTFDNEIQ